MRRREAEGGLESKKVEVFSPCHISGFFSPIITDSVLETGSTGCGITLSHGVSAEISAGDRKILC